MDVDLDNVRFGCATVPGHPSSKKVGDIGGGIPPAPNAWLAISSFKYLNLSATDLENGGTERQDSSNGECITFRAVVVLGPKVRCKPG